MGGTKGESRSELRRFSPFPAAKKSAFFLPAPLLSLLLLLPLGPFSSVALADSGASCDADTHSDSGMCAFPSTPEPSGGDGSPAPADTGSSLVLYGSPVSSCTRRVLLTLLEKGLTDFKFEVINLAKGEQKKPEYMKLQPYGQVPVLRDLSKNLTLFESRAIARYVAEKYEQQGTPLLGTTLEERALVNVWFESESQEFNPQAGVIAYEMVIAARYGRTPNKEKADEAAQKLANVLDVYEDRLESNQYLAGERVSLADLSHIPYMIHLWPAGYGSLIEDRPNVNAWWGRITTRASWQRILEGIP